MFFKTCVLKNVTNLPKKNFALESLFNKIGDLKACNFIKKRLQKRCFFVKVLKYLNIHGTPLVDASDGISEK